MSESEAETTWMSRIDMNIPNTMIRNATSRRGAMRSEASAGALIIPEFAVVASAMAPFSYASPDLLTVGRRRRRAEIGGRIGIVGTPGGVDGGVDRHTGAQQVFARDFARHVDAHRSRCTIFVKLPVALSGGSSVNTE